VGITHFDEAAGHDILTARLQRLDYWDGED